MRFYLYRSINKIEMLFEQIPESVLAEYSKEMSLSLGFISGKAKRKEGPLTLDKKMAAVLSELDRLQKIGTLDDTKPYFRCKLRMDWRNVNFKRNANAHAHEIKESDREIIIFAGFDGDSRRLVALLGSASNMTGMTHLSPATIGYSAPFHWQRLINEIDISDQDKLSYLSSEIPHVAMDTVGMSSSDDMKIYNVVARRFVNLDTVTIGSPIYVAEID